MSEPEPSAPADPTPVADSKPVAAQAPLAAQAPVADSSLVSVPALIDDYRRQQDDWRAQTAALVQLRSEVFTAADREAEAIVANARTEIRKILVTARRELLGLAIQIQNLSYTEDEPDIPAVVDVASVVSADNPGSDQRLIDARHDLVQVLEEVQPDLEALQSDLDTVRHHTHRESAAPEPVSVPQFSQHASGRTEAAAAVRIEPFVAGLDNRGRSRSRARVLSTAFALAGIGLSLSVLSWNRLSTSGASRQPAPVRAESQAPARSPQQAVGTPDPATSGTAGSLPKIPTSTADTAAPRADNTPSSAVVSRPVAAAPAVPGGSAAPPRAGAPVADSRTTPGAAPVRPRTGSDDQAVLTAAAESWFDAYYRRDTARMASVSTGDVKISDQRSVNERPPAGKTVDRVLERPTFQMAGESAVLTARMIETDGSADAHRYLSWVAQVWIRDSGPWRLTDVRIISDAKLK